MGWKRVDDGETQGGPEKTEEGRRIPSTFSWGWDCHCPASRREERGTSVLGVAKPQDGSAYISLSCANPTASDWVLRKGGRCAHPGL